MTKAADVTDSGEAREMRAAMTDRLLAEGWITSPLVEAAFRAVPRHVFVPDGTPLEHAYATDVAPITKRDEHGIHLSSVSAPWLQARMICWPPFFLSVKSAPGVVAGEGHLRRGGAGRATTP